MVKQVDIEIESKTGNTMETAGLDQRYLAFFERFSGQEYFEAHEVLEELWLPVGVRQGPDGAFYKGLIQLAGAFVHIQKGRWNPAAALLELARANLKAYPAAYLGLDVDRLGRRIIGWLGEIRSGNWQGEHPRLQLESGG
jgi:predicted metal-dependent hydrolase